jgi:hypothetical protein
LQRVTDALASTGVRALNGCLIGTWTLAMMARTTAALMAGLASFCASTPGWAQSPAQNPAPLGDPPPLSDAAFDAAFQCPEALADDAGRRRALVDYFHWSLARHPDWSLAEAVEFKKTLLVRHRCTDSLRDLAAYAKQAH